MRGFEKEVDELKILKCSQPTDIGLALGGADHDSPDFWVSLKSLKKVTDMFHHQATVHYLKFNISNI